MIDLNSIYLLEDFTLYQLLGFSTVFLSLLNIALYAVSAYLVWRSTHDVTKTLRDKLILEALLTLTTVAMGVAALIEAPQSFWQSAYIARVILLILMPFFIWRLVKSCLAIIKS